MKMLTVVLDSSGSDAEVTAKLGEVLEEYLRQRRLGFYDPNAMDGDSGWDFQEDDINDNCPCIKTMIEYFTGEAVYVPDTKAHTPE
jgi:hypothetical protein